MMSDENRDLLSKHCFSAADSNALEIGGIRLLLNEVGKHWKLADDHTYIQADFSFGNFHETMAFANAVAWIAHREDHHPDMEIGYKHCLVRYTTHAAGGLSENDFICASKIDALLF